MVLHECFLFIIRTILNKIASNMNYRKSSLLCE